MVYILSSWDDFTSSWGKWHKHMSPSGSAQMEDLSHSTLLFSYGDTSVPVQKGGVRLRWANTCGITVRVHSSDVGSGACSPHSSFPSVVICLLARRMRCVTSWVLAHMGPARSATCNASTQVYTRWRPFHKLFSLPFPSCMAALSTWPQGWGCDKEALGDRGFFYFFPILWLWGIFYFFLNQRPLNP